MFNFKVVFFYKGLNTQIPFSTIDNRGANSARTYPTDSVSNSGIPLGAINQSEEPMVTTTTRWHHNPNGSHFLDKFLMEEFEETIGLANNSKSSGKPPVRPGFMERSTVYIDHSDMTVKLVINDVQLDDEGIYRCRIDYRWRKTFVKFMRLELIGMF